jgi:hypothetical protein
MKVELSTWERLTLIESLEWFDKTIAEMTKGKHAGKGINPKDFNELMQKLGGKGK